MKIAIDIDNTVFTNNSIIYKLLNNVQILGDKNDTTLEFSKVSPKPIPTKGLLKKIFPFINPSKFVAYRDSVDVINLMFEKGHEIVFVSNRPTLLKGPTLELLERFDIKYDALILGCKNKHTFCKHFGIDLLIDDQQKNCVNVANIGIDAICLDHKTDYINITDEKQKHLFHATCWKSVEHMISYIDHFSFTTKGINAYNDDLRTKTLVDFFKSAKPLYREIVLSKYFKEHMLKTDMSLLSTHNQSEIKQKIKELQQENETLKRENEELRRK